LPGIDLDHEVKFPALGVQAERAVREQVVAANREFQGILAVKLDQRNLQAVAGKQGRNDELGQRIGVLLASNASP
jgi:hypothetical protein